MTRGRYGRFKKAESKNLEKKQLRIEEIGQTWLSGRKPTKVCSAK
jgi:hypothetical protein